MAGRYKYVVQGQGTIVFANSYLDAAVQLFGQKLYELPGKQWKLRTTYVRVRKGYAEVRVYKPGDKQGSYWGVAQDIPEMYILRRVVN